jgi:CubicO group peptidase (beta-lactamase class C family)
MPQKTYIVEFEQKKNMRSVLGTLFTITFYLLLCYPSKAQQDSLAHQRMAQFIRIAINESNSEAIYRLTSDKFRQKMTEVQFSIGVKKFKVKTGEWVAVTFRAKNEKGLDYIADFELGQQLFSLKLDVEGKIERMNFSVIPVTISPKAEQVQSDNSLENKLDLVVERLVRPYIQKGNTVGLVLAVIDGGRVYKYSYGRADKRRRELPRPSTIFEIGSVTKTFTSLLLAQEVVSGKMRLEDPIKKYLPDSIPLNEVDGDPIRLAHLSNHTSGFPRLPANIFNGNVNPKDPYRHYVVDSLYSFLVDYRTSVQPGKVFSYSNYGAGLLGTILERQLGADFGKLIENRISRPLHMMHTFVDIPSRLQSTFAQGYNEQGLATSPWDLASLKGSGAVRSTLDDMILYVKAQLGEKNAIQKAIEFSHLPTFSGPSQVMGLGWRMGKINQQGYYHHSGGTGGFRSYVGFEKTRQFGVVILSNAADDVTEIGESLMRL